MNAAGGEPTAIAAGRTDLRRFVPYSVLVTAVVVALPLWVGFGLASSLGAFSSVLSMATSILIARVASHAWQRHPGSRDVVFNDLVLWGFIRRARTQRRLLRKVERLGLASSALSEMSIEKRTELLKELAVALETGDPYTHGHSERVARHAYMVAKAMKLPRYTAEKIRLAGVIHDVGKLRIPREILTKPGALTPAEYDIVKAHTLLGAAMVELLDDPDVTDMVRHHHERLDGTGYPDGLHRSEISMGARILAVADTFDAASSLRPYRAAQKHKVALDILATEAAAGRLDRDVVDAFTHYYSGRRGMRWWALLSASPRHIYEVAMLVLQRFGATGVANAALVGATAVALAPGSPIQARLHERPQEQRVRAVSQVESNASAAPVSVAVAEHTDAVKGKKLENPRAGSTGADNRERDDARSSDEGRAGGAGSGSGKDHDDKGNGNGSIGHPSHGDDDHGRDDENVPPAHGPGGVGGHDSEPASSEEPKDKDPKDKGPKGDEDSTDGGDSGSDSSGPSNGNPNPGGGNSGNGNSGNGSGGDATDDDKKNDGDEGSDGSSSGGDDTSEPPSSEPSEPAGPGNSNGNGNSGSPPGSDNGGSNNGNGNGNGGGKDK